MKVKPSNRSGNPGGVVVELGPAEAELPGSRTLPVFRLKRILVPVDFSVCSKKALEYALPFARQFGASVHLLYIVQPYVPVSDLVPMDVESIETRMRDTGERELAALQQEIDRDVKTEAMVRVGNPHMEIVRAASELDIDLIILSTHGRTGFSHVLMGSTTERVVRHAACPVLVLREHEHEFIEK